MLRNGPFDKVVVLTGRDKGKEGEITQVMPKDGKAIVDGINIAIRHTRQSQTSQGGRLPNTLSIGFPGMAAGEIMDAAPHVAVSAGAACHGGGATISHVLAAMGVDPTTARGTLRFSLGRFTKREEVEAGAEAITRAIASLRS